MNAFQSDIEINPITDELLASFIGRRAQIGASPIGALKPYYKETGTVVKATRDTIVESEILLIIELDSGKQVAAGYNEMRFLPRQDADEAEGSDDA